MEDCWPTFQIVSYCAWKQESTQRNKKESIFIRKIFLYRNGLRIPLAGSKAPIPLFLSVAEKGPLASARGTMDGAEQSSAWWAHDKLHLRGHSTPDLKEIAEAPLGTAFWIQLLRYILRRTEGMPGGLWEEWEPLAGTLQLCSNSVQYKRQIYCNSFLQKFQEVP